LILAQLASPIVLILLGATVLAFFLGDGADAGIVLAIVVVSAALGVWAGAQRFPRLEGLLAQVATRVQVVREGQVREVPLAEIVPGDVTVLSAGRSVPGDGLLIEARDLFISEAALTGESEPAEKSLGPSAPNTPLARRSSAVFLGTHVISGAAHAVMAETGARTELGQVAARVASRRRDHRRLRGLGRAAEAAVLPSRHRSSTPVAELTICAVFARNDPLHAESAPFRDRSGRSLRPRRLVWPLQHHGA